MGMEESPQISISQCGQVTSSATAPSDDELDRAWQRLEAGKYVPQRLKTALALRGYTQAGRPAGEVEKLGKLALQNSGRTFSECSTEVGVELDEQSVTSSGDEPRRVKF